MFFFVPSNMPFFDILEILVVQNKFLFVRTGEGGIGRKLEVFRCKVEVFLVSTKR